MPKLSKLLKRLLGIMQAFEEISENNASFMWQLDDPKKMANKFEK